MPQKRAVFWLCIPIHLFELALACKRKQQLLASRRAESFKLPCWLHPACEHWCASTWDTYLTSEAFFLIRAVVSDKQVFPVYLWNYRFQCTTFRLCWTDKQALLPQSKFARWYANSFALLYSCAIVIVVKEAWKRTRRSGHICELRTSVIRKYGRTVVVWIHWIHWILAASARARLKLLLFQDRP